MGQTKPERLPIFLSYLLRHAPQAAALDMDSHGWVSVAQLIRGVNATGKYRLDRATLEEIVATDDKGRFRFSRDGQRIKACQGHSIPWVQPELEILPPPRPLYHGTTAAALEKILASGESSKMSRHAVHMQADARKAWQSAVRWKGKTPVVLKVDAVGLAENGAEFGRTENGVWCCEAVPVEYIVEQLCSVLC